MRETAEAEDLAMDTAEKFVKLFAEQFGPDEVPQIIAAVLDWYVFTGSTNFARNHVIPQQFKLLDGLEISYRGNLQ